MGADFKGITATRKELREGGYFYAAKLMVLRNLWEQERKTSNVEDDEVVSAPF